MRWQGCDNIIYNAYGCDVATRLVPMSKVVWQGCTTHSHPVRIKLKPTMNAYSWVFDYIYKFKYSR